MSVAVQSKDRAPASLPEMFAVRYQAAQRFHPKRHEYRRCLNPECKDVEILGILHCEICGASPNEHRKAPC